MGMLRSHSTLARVAPLLLLVTLADPTEQQACSVNVSGAQMPKPQPLLLRPGGSRDIHGFLAPDAAGTISLNQSETIVIACPGPDNTILATGGAVATAMCISGSTFTINGHPYQFVDFKCEKKTEPSAERTNKSCGSNDQYTIISLGFQVGSDFYTLTSVCFDARSYRTVYDNSTLVAQIGGQQTGTPTPRWATLGFFGQIPMKYQYQRTTEIDTFSKLLGSSSLGPRYISNTTDYYLSKGHLTAKLDFALSAQQGLTYVYLNCAPQWYTFNCGNWNTMENDVRSYAANRSKELAIYTGTYGITTLPNVHNKDTELYLYTDRTSSKKYVPVPKIFWKIVYDTIEEAAVVMLGINNPYIDDPGPDYHVCNDVSNRIRWLHWNATDQVMGYSYCCEYTDFKNTVADIPDLVVRGLLT